MTATGATAEQRVSGPRLIAIVGPFQSGKTSLLEGLLARGGGAARQGSARLGRDFLAWLGVARIFWRGKARQG